MKIILLTSEFYKDFSHYAEVELKKERPYIMLLVSFNGFDFAIPFRSYISHNFCFKTTNIPNLVNGKEKWSGIDYTKSVIVFDKKYISSEEPSIRKEEFNNIKFKEYIIEQQFIKYITKYIECFTKIQLGIHKDRDLFLCKFSTLQNYHKELKILDEFKL